MGRLSPLLVRSYSDTQRMQVRQVLRKPVIQAKLAIGAPDDTYEKEADRVTDEVMRMSDGDEHVQRLCPACDKELQCQPVEEEQEELQMLRQPMEEEEEELQLRRQPEENEEEEELLQAKENLGQTLKISSSVESGINDIRGGGLPLGVSERAFFDSRFGRTFNDVRIHNNGHAAELAASINARAFTLGSDVVFGANEYSPSTVEGKRLLAHELAHVVQQTMCGEPQRIARQIKYDWRDEYKGIIFFSYTEKGIQVLAGLPLKSQERAVRKQLKAIVKRIDADNKMIADAAYHVKRCFIFNTTTRFALYKGKSILLLQPKDADATTVAHEMGHAIYHYLTSLQGGRTKRGRALANIPLLLADIYLRAAKTRLVTMGKATRRAGLWMVDPSQWAPGSAVEHPWDNADEYFASAREGYVMNRRGLRRSIARFARKDAAVKPIGRDLYKVLGAMARNRSPGIKLSAARQAAAAKHLQTIEKPTKLEDFLGTRTYRVARLMLDPSLRKAPEPGTGVSIKTERPRKKLKNLVTGEGGVIDQMIERHNRRIREKILQSASEID